MIFTRIHSDQVALHSAAAILQHSAELFPIIKDEEVDVEFRWSSLVICNLSSAIGINCALALIQRGYYEAAKTLRALAGEKSICVTGAGAQKRVRRQGLTCTRRHEALASCPVTCMGGSNAAFVLGEGRTRQQRAYENQEPAVFFHDDLLK